jgi:hypothetical protein
VFFERCKVSFLRHHVLTEETVINRLGLLLEQVIVRASKRSVFNLLLCRNVNVWVCAPLLVQTRALVVIPVIVRLGCFGVVALVLRFGMLFAFGVLRHLEHV